MTREELAVAGAAACVVCCGVPAAGVGIVAGLVLAVRRLVRRPVPA